MQVGNDDWGQRYLENLQKMHVNTEHVTVINNKPTGKAHINVGENGDNQIVIIPGANDTIAPADIESIQHVLDASKVQF